MRRAEDKQSVSEAFANYFTICSPGVIATWLAMHVFLLFLSRFAKRQSRRGNSAWARWALLPAFELLILVRQLSLVGNLLGWVGMEVSSGCASFGASFTFWALSLGIYKVINLIVYIFLVAHSAGSRTMRKALAAVVTLMLIYWVVLWGEWVDSSAKHFRDFSCGLGWGPSWLQTSIPTWIGIRWTFLPYVGCLWLLMVLICFWMGTIVRARVTSWSPRQGWLCVLLCILWASTLIAAMYSGNFYDAAGLLPDYFIQSVELPLLYYILLKESRYWTEWNFHGSNGIRALDEVATCPLKEQVACEMMEVQNNLRQTMAVVEDSTTQDRNSSAAFSWTRSTSQTTSVGLKLKPTQKNYVPHIHFSRIQLGSVLAKGAEGIVYSALMDGSPCAVKSLTCKDLDQHVIRPIIDEIALSWHLAEGCPNIVKCEGFSIAPPSLQIVMPLCAGGSLLSVLATRSFECQQQLRIALKCTTAVAHLHSLEFVHRDLKSPNFFCCFGGKVSDSDVGLEVLLGDFGETCTVQSALKAERRQYGTLCWMAPELIENWKVRRIKQTESTDSPFEGSAYTTGADVYSLSVVLWECFTQRQPYVEIRHEASQMPLAEARPFALGDQIVNGLRPPLNVVQSHHKINAIDPGVCRVTSLGWDKVPSQRPTSAEMEMVLSGSILKGEEEEGESHYFQSQDALQQEGQPNQTEKIGPIIESGTVCKGAVVRL